MDQRTVVTDPEDIVGERHVFVSGLARAGTTVLMRRFYATNLYCSLTYRDMPFVLAPNLWRKLACLSKRTVAATTERAHGDRIMVDVDSPEGLEEVFWRVFTGDTYIERKRLKPHLPDSETRWKYVCYINAILNAKDGRVSRYLSKNNNNILRLNTIRHVFPRALILIPFREPLSHAGSLLRQHRNFVKAQENDRFVRSYMTWLVHHEFGLDHRPFRFDEDCATQAYTYRTDMIDYWLELWCATYGWLEYAAPKDAIFVCYEDLCSCTDVWLHLAKISGISNECEEYDPFILSDAIAEEANEVKLVEQASCIYDRLTNKARAVLY